MTKTFDCHLIINTHWDREWRWSFRETQLRLVEAMDLLLETMEKDPGFVAFHTDSQTSVIDDYLEMRPESHERVKRLVEAGRLHIGPWYTLPAEFLVSGESLVRNLLLGHKIGSAFGGVMKTAYNIFSWGQVSQLPQIYRQFGMDTIIFYRGIDQSSLSTLEFWWEAPDGRRSLGLTFGSQHRLNFWSFVYKPYIMGSNKLGMDRTQGAGFLVNLCDPYSSDINHWMFDQICAKDESSITPGMEKLIASVKEKASTNSLLFFQGFDLENPDPIVPSLVSRINDISAEANVHISTLPRYVETLKNKLAEGGRLESLPVLRGEMLEPERVNASFGDLFSQVFSARMPVKLENAACEVRLERWAEPSSCWAASWGAAYPTRQLQTAWKELLKNQQHDGIGGAHNDRITETMGERFRDVKDLAEAITRKSLQSIVAKIDCSSLSERETALVVFNSAAFPRDAVVDVVIDIPSTYFTGDGIFAQMGGFISLKQLTVSDSSGHPVPLQVHDQWEELVFGYRKFGAHFSQPMRRFKAAFEASAIPAMGYRSFRAGFKERFDRPRETLSPEPNRMENVHMRVQINGDGTLDIFDKSTKRMYPRQHYFLDEAEMGNALRHVAPGDEGTISSLGEPATVTLVCAGPLCATFRVERVWMLPAEIDASLRVWPPQVGQWIEPCRPHRSKRRVPMQIVTEITLRKDSRVLEFSTTIDNNVRDHRLRLVFPTGLNPSVHVADSPFDVVERLVARPDASGWREDALSQWPMTSWIDVCEGNQGVAFLHRWVGEYEVFDNRCGTLAITLLRCFSCPGGLGETYPAQQLAQCPGKHTFEYAFFPHAGNWREAEVPRIAEDFRVPMRIAQTSRHPGSAPFDHFSFVSVEPAALFRVTALKAAEDGLGYILRGFSHAEKPIAATIRFAVPVSRVEKVSLEEVAMDILETSEGGTCVTLDVHPGEIASIRIIP